MNYISDIAKEYFPSVPKTVLYSILRYLFRDISSSQLNKDIREELGSKTNIIKFRKELTRKGYIFNLKAWLFACVHYEVSTPEEVRKLASMYEVHETDLELANMLYGPLLDTLREYTLTYKVLSLKKFRKHVTRIIKEVEVYTRKFVNKKHRFLMKSNHFDLEDFVLELIAKGIQSLILMYPCVKSSLHATNVVKTSIKHHGINLIKHYTSKKKATLVRFSDGTFGSLKISYNTLLNERSYDKTSTYTVSDICGGLSDSSESGNSKLDMQLSVLQLEKGVKPKQKTFIRLLMGEYHQGFTVWLNNKGITNKDNDDWHSMLLKKNTLDRYIKLTLDYLGVSRQAGYRFLNKLQLRLE